MLLAGKVRDYALGIEDEADQVSEVNKEYALKQAETTGERPDYTTKKPNDLLMKLQRTTPYYKVRNQSLASLFVLGFLKSQLSQALACTAKQSTNLQLLCSWRVQARCRVPLPP